MFASCRKQSTTAASFGDTLIAMPAPAAKEQDPVTEALTESFLALLPSDDAIKTATGIDDDQAIRNLSCELNVITAEFGNKMLNTYLAAKKEAASRVNAMMEDFKRVATYVKSTLDAAHQTPGTSLYLRIYTGIPRTDIELITTRTVAVYHYLANLSEGVPKHAPVILKLITAALKESGFYTRITISADAQYTFEKLGCKPVTLLGDQGSPHLSIDICVVF